MDGERPVTLARRPVGGGREEQVGDVVAPGRQVPPGRPVQAGVPAAQPHEEGAEAEQGVDPLAGGIEDAEVVMVDGAGAGLDRHSLRGVGGDHRVVVAHGRGVQRPRVVIAVLSAAEFVAGHHHRDAAREHEDGPQVAQSLAAQPLVAPGIPGQVVVAAAVGGAEGVGLVVDLGLVAHEVGQVEAVMGDDEVDGLLRAAVVLEVVVVAVDHVEEVRGVRVALGEAAHGIAIAAVPLAPAAGEVAHLIAPQIPGLGDDLDVLGLGQRRDAGQQGVLVEEALEGAPIVGRGVGGQSPQHGGQIEAEAVDPHDGAPVVQRVQHESAGRRGGVAHLVGGAGGAVDQTLVAGHLVVLGGGESAQGGETGGGDVAVPVAALGRVVVDDVEVDLHAGGVEGGDHLLELAGGSTRASVCRVLAVGREEVQGHVAPRVGRARAGGLGGVGLVDGQELDGSDPGRPEIGGQEPRAPVGALIFGRNIGYVLETRLAGEQVRQTGRRRVTGELSDARPTSTPSPARASVSTLWVISRE